MKQGFSFNNEAPKSPERPFNKEYLDGLTRINERILSLGKRYSNLNAVLNERNGRDHSVLLDMHFNMREFNERVLAAKNDSPNMDILRALEKEMDERGESFEELLNKLTPLKHKAVNDNEPEKKETGS